MNERKLIAGLKSHDNNIMAYLIDKYGGYVYTIVSNIVGSYMTDEDVEEISSDVFVSVWKAADNIDETKSLKAYIIGVARNTAKNALRYQTRHHIASEPIDEIDIPSFDSGGIVKTEILLIITEYISTLKSDDKEVFIRYYYEYQKADDIAREMSVSVSAVKMKLHRIRISLREVLNERGYESYES